MNYNEIKRHFGVYGVCIRNGKLLCIKKERGPYKNRFDLPGGSQKDYEGLTETLVREVFEETGYKVETYENSRIYDVIVQEKDEEFCVHHIMALYDIEVDKANINKVKIDLGNEKNDSSGFSWIEINELTIENSSPLILKVKEEFNGEDVLDKTVYHSWEVKN